MYLSNLTPLIELAAGLNIAFVAVEVAKGYTSILLNKVFNFNDVIEEDFDKLESSIEVKRKALNLIEPTDIPNIGNTNIIIEETKRNYEKSLNEVKMEKQRLLDWAQSNCEFKCFSGLSLMLFLYCCFLLFLSAWEYNYAIGISCILTLIYCVLSYKFNKGFQCSNLKWSIGFFAIITTISFPFIWVGENWHCSFLDCIQPYIVIAAVLLPFINFIIFYFMIMYKVRKMKDKVHESKKEFEDKLKPTNDKFELLQSFDKLKVGLQPKQ